MAVWKPLKKRVQNELVKRGHCVGCTRSLAEADREEYPDNEKIQLVICACGRIFVYNKQLNTYRRAELNEVKQKKGS